MGFWNNLTARQKSSKRERFEYVMNAVSNITPGESTGTDYSEDIDSLKSRVAVLEANDFEDLIARIESLEEAVGPEGEGPDALDEEL